MKINFDKQKSAETLSNLLHKTTDAGKTALTAVQQGASNLSGKAKQASHERKLKKYNPLFPDEFYSDSFALPNMIVIVDDAVRRDIDVCKGAIGWRNKCNGTEVLFLYDEAVHESGIQFIPSATCDAVYYVDSYNRNRFIRTDCIFKQAHEERLAELKHVAHCLGAKNCSIDIIESVQQASQSRTGATSRETLTKEDDEKSKKDNTNVTETYNRSFETQSHTHVRGRIIASFAGDGKPCKPELKWFAHDDNIKRLIDMRCNDVNMLQSETLELSGASSATMSQKTACAIDGAISQIGFHTTSSMEKQANTENNSTLIFSVEF